jgi:hypothetical protein
MAAAMENKGIPAIYIDSGFCTQLKKVIEAGFSLPHLDNMMSFFNLPLFGRNSNGLYRDTPFRHLSSTVLIKTSSLLYITPSRPLLPQTKASPTFNPSKLTMSLYIEGLPAASVSFQQSPKSSLSSTFYQNLVGVSGNRLLFTTAIPSFSSYSSLVECNISHGLQTDVVLGLDWAAHVRESLICSGYRLDSTFDAWCFFSYPTHPINGLF